MEWTIYSKKQGCGYICTKENEILEHVKQVEATINNKTIVPGEETTLDGHFTRPLKYIGRKAEGHNEMIFELGIERNLFEVKCYYQAIFKIEENRIYEMFSHKSGRDFYYINGIWK